MEQFEQTERDLLELSDQVTTLGEFFTWTLQCAEFIEQLETRCSAKRQRLSDNPTIGQRQSLVARIARLEGVKLRLERQFIHSGGDYANAGTSGDTRTTELIWREIDAAFKKRIITGAVINTDHVEPRKFLEDACSVVCKQVRDSIKTHNCVKVNTVFNGEFVAGDKRDNKSFNTNNIELCGTSHLREWYELHVIEPTLAKLEEFQERDSGWALTRILNLTVSVNKYNPLRAGCHMKLPQDIKVKNAVINVLSMDNVCFAWSVVAALHPTERHSERESSYPHYSTVLNVRDIEFPMTLSQIKKFERLNNISVNVYTIEGKKTSNVLPIRLTDHTNDNHVNLLYMQDPQDNNVGHFAWIKHLSRLVSSQINKHGHTKYICDRCLHYFSSSDKLQSHTVECRKVNKCAIRLPSEDNKWLSFKNHSRKERLSFVVYADLECVLQKTQPETEHASYAYQHHRVCSIAYYVQCSYDETLSTYRFRRDNDCVAWFVEELNGLAHRVKNILSDIVCMVDLTRDEWETFHSATKCHICEQQFAPDDNKVRDHCHLTGRYRGPAHSTCNLNYKDPHFIPVIFHNLSGYDAHFIIKEIAAAFEGSIDVLPITKEKYISFTKHVKDTAEISDLRSDIQLRFIDSYKFLSASLAKLASFLDNDKLKIIRSKFSALSDDDFKLLTRKGVFPYEYVDSVEKLEDTCLPPHDSFYNSLTGETVSESDYAHATNVWQRFSVRTLGEYSDLYLKTDVLLLADVFENFRDSCVASYGLDPAYYYTLPGFTWDAMLKHTCIKFELLTDIDMVMFIERGIRGGLSQCSGRYAKANNKYMKSYDSSKPSSYLMYFDVNNLYGWAMCKPLPYAEFRWVEDSSNFDVNTIALDSSTGYILEVDLEYPQDKHDAHADLPFCPMRDKPPGKRQDKLLATLHDKERYVIHYRNLQQCMRHGIRVTKIYRVLQFAQSEWLRSYIELNTKFRTQAKNEFEKTLYKLMNNAVFGKTMENVRNHVDVKLVTKWEGRYGAEAMIARPNFPQQ
ncbi:uncharacterized protein [Temnothorax longispinosus]|uniref:uncharacterized protein n=1 Tax=Temnothorax longispinosus TaxID=300112 RepID=UPI003A99FDD4